MLEHSEERPGPHGTSVPPAGSGRSSLFWSVERER